MSNETRLKSGSPAVLKIAGSADAKSEAKPEAGSKHDKWEAFQVPWLRHVGTQMACKFTGFWKRCGNLESSILGEVLEPIAVNKPIYIAGLVRSGSTVLLETVAAFSGVASHRYRDFPFVFTPYWWNKYLDKTPRKQAEPRPRVHADGLAVSPESPEALEEPLWMSFFPRCHDSNASQVLDGQTDRPDFEKFYKNHVRKVLAIRGGERYACKANYHVSRMEYLLKMFPDARIILPIRQPRDHVASLMKQDKLFCEGESRHPRSLVQMQSCGHFEFGLDRRAINFGENEAVKDVESLWTGGEAARGWARYWSNVYGYLAERLAVNHVLRNATQVVWFEELCEQPLAMVQQISEHCELKSNPFLLQQLASKLHAPTYYKPSFTRAEEAAIEDETEDVVRLLAPKRDQPAAAWKRAA